MIASSDRSAASRPILLEEKLAAAWRRFRGQKLADRAFRRRAAANPLTRPFATRSARTLFDLTAGFVYSQVLKAVVQLDLLDKVAGDAKTADQLAGPLGLTPEAARTLLDAAVALDLLDRRDGAYEIAALGSALRGESGVGAMIAHHDMLYDDLRDPVALLRREGGPTRLQAFWPYAGGGGGQVTEEGVGPYSELMAQSQSFVADDVLDMFSFGDRNTLLDFGGGEGVFAEAAAVRFPHLKVTLLDLPPVAARAEKRFAQAGLAGRATAIGGDLFADPALPGRADVVSLVRVLHDHDDAAALRLLKAAHAALDRGGEVMVAEPLAEMPGGRRVGHAYFGFYLFAMGSGRPRTAAEIAALMTRAGFWNMRTRYTRGALPFGVVTARRAGEGPIWRD